MWNDGALGSFLKSIAPTIMASVPDAERLSFCNSMIQRTCCRHRCQQTQWKQAQDSRSCGCVLHWNEHKHNTYKGPIPWRPQTMTMTAINHHHDGHKPSPWRPQTMTATNHDGHKPWPWRPQRWKREKLMPNVPLSSFNTKLVVIVCGCHGHGMWPSFSNPHTNSTRQNLWIGCHISTNTNTIIFNIHSKTDE